MTLQHNVADSGGGEEKADKGVDCAEGDFDVGHLPLPDQDMLGSQKHGGQKHGSKVNAAQIHF